jgi:anti-sigma factor RsiW
MNCQECERLFDEMIDRRVEEPTRQRMELHLSRCGICRSRLEHRKKSHTLMFRALNAADVRLHLPNGFADRLVAECRSQPKRSFFPALPRWALIAASLAIIAGFVFAANVVIDAVTTTTDDGGRGATALPDTTEESPTESSGRAVAPRPPLTDGLDETALPSINYQLQTIQGETTMTKKKAAVAALASAIAAAPLTAARGDGYQYIISGDPVAAETADSSSASSATSSLTSGTLADGHVLASELEARYRTAGESAVTALRSDKFNATIIIFK